MIDVSDRPDVHVRLAAVEFFLCHNAFSVCGVPTGGGLPAQPAVPGSLPANHQNLEPLTRIELVTFRYGRSTRQLPF
jgi:hypothetical protein